MKLLFAMFFGSDGGGYIDPWGGGHTGGGSFIDPAG